MATTTPETFDEFKEKVDYEIVNRIDNPSWTKKKIYDKFFWLFIPSKIFSINLGDTHPRFTCFVRTQGEQFGDTIAPTEFDYDIEFRCYDSSNNLVIKDAAQITNTNICEITYIFKKIDFQKRGRYHAELIFKKENETFTLPNSGELIEIVVK